MGVLADKLGYSSVWIPDHLSDLPPAGDKVDPWTIFGAIGYSTNNVRLIPGVTDSIRIHPAKLANVVATLDDFTGGRADVGIGAGERMNTERYGMEWQLDPKLRLKKLREAILLMRGLLNSSIEKPFSFDGDYFKLKNARIDQKPAHRIKFIVGSLGSKESLELTGAVADGWYPVFNTVESFRKRCSIVEEAARRSGRNVEEIEKIHSCFCVTSNESEKRKRAIEVLKYSLLTLESKKMLGELAKRGLVDNNKKRAAKDLVSYQHMDPTVEGTKLAMDVARKIPEEIVEQYIAVGGSSEIREQIEPFVKAGATHVVLYDVYSLSVSARSSDFELFLRDFSKVLF